MPTYSCLYSYRGMWLLIEKGDTFVSPKSSMLAIPSECFCLFDIIIEKQALSS